MCERMPRLVLHTAQENISDSVVNGIFMWYPALFYKHAFMPILAATAATIRVWLDCTPPMETILSAFDAIATGMMYSSLGSLLPPFPLDACRGGRASR
ncbi:hypothetical protein RCCGE510_30891 (plasmid) [Rhizobium sp. CCGE 510]|nr:hypothetical protein RCCGE510_30891 [Rhizobium sp. CCGE 510]